MAQKLSILYFAALMLAVSGTASCTRNGGDDGKPDETPAYEQGFSMGTRVDAAGYPEHGDAYVLISYRVGGTSSTYEDKMLIRDNGTYGGKQFGHYAYDDGSSYGTPGALIPIDPRSFVEHNGNPANPPYVPQYGIDPLVKAPTYAQMLRGVPVEGHDPATGQGLFRTAVIHPAIPVFNTSEFGRLAVFNLGEKVYASMPDDADGDPSTDDPFEIEVTHNDQIHPLPYPLELYPVESGIRVRFYSEYYADSDPDELYPFEQEFEIASLQLFNVGSNGWYSARTGMVYPNYNYSNTYRTTYSSQELGVGSSGSRPNFLDLKTSVYDDGEAGPGKAKNPIRYSVESPVFPSDYRGYESGGIFEVKPLILQVVLDMDSGGQNKVSVPIAMEMKRGKRYNFYINVLSQILIVKYNVSPWGEGYDDDDTIGGYLMDYATIDLRYNPDGWVDVDGGNDEIGN